MRDDNFFQSFSDEKIEVFLEQARQAEEEARQQQARQQQVAEEKEMVPPFFYEVEGVDEQFTNAVDAVNAYRGKKARKKGIKRINRTSMNDERMREQGCHEL